MKYFGTFTEGFGDIRDCGGRVVVAIDSFRKICYFTVTHTTGIEFNNNIRNIFSSAIVTWQGMLFKFSVPISRDSNI